GNFADSIVGGAGADSLLGGGGDDSIRGGSGADVINAGAGVNLIEDAGEGSDRVTHDAASSTVVIAVTGTDTVTLLASQPGASVRIATALNATISASGSTAAVIVTGDAGSDSIAGGGGADSLLGGAGVDTLSGGVGSDTMVGGAGSDRFVFAAGDSGQDLLFDVIQDYQMGVLGAGDVIDYSAPLKITAKRGTGIVVNDRGIVSFTAPPSDLTTALNILAGQVVGVGEFALFQLREADDFYLFIADANSGKTDGDVVVQLKGVTRAVRGVVDGRGDLTIVGSLLIEGTEGPDTLVGDAGDDTLKGNGGNDSLVGNDGDDSQIGGAGDDTIEGAQGDVLIDGGDGTDVLRLGINFSASSDGQIVNVEVVELTGAGVSVNLGNQTESFRIKGFATGISSISAGAGDDSISGGSLADSLAGGAGNDTLIGGVGDDTLTGGAGADVIDGGAGVDTAVYVAGATFALNPSTSKWEVTGGEDSTTDVLENVEVIKIGNVANLVGSLAVVQNTVSALEAAGSLPADFNAIIIDAAGAPLAASALSALGGKTTGVVTVSDAVEITGTAAEVKAALVTADTLVQAGSAKVTVTDSIAV
ncbi:MAG: calcium-binding protein, partial [Betaproteobacteria bacterium]|nr:calcium-binding protein [Betaproteobacteria bacterium]